MCDAGRIRDARRRWRGSAAAVKIRILNVIHSEASGSRKIITDWEKMWSLVP